MKTKTNELEKEKFTSLVNQNRNLIYKVCNSYCADQESRKDLQQEILIQLWTSLNRFDGRVKISTWIYRVALNTAINFYRNDSKLKKNRVELDAAIISDCHTAQEPAHKEVIENIYALINKLGEMDRALMLLYLDDFKYADIAEILGISVTNVGTKINRIKSLLRTQFFNQKP